MKKEKILIKKLYIFGVLVILLVSAVGCEKRSSKDLEPAPEQVKNHLQSDLEDIEALEPENLDAEVLNTEALNPEASEPEDSVPEDNTVTISMVGDILLHTPVSEAALNADGSYDYHAIFSKTKALIEDADLAIVNEEVIIGGKDLGVSGYPAFNAPYEIGDALYDTGFDVVLQATNHALDKGSKGIINCLSYWDCYHPDIAVLGIHDSEDDQNNIDTFTINGITIAILNYTYGTNGINLPENMPFAVDMLDEDKVISDINIAKEKADFVIVCPHWGTEYNLGVDAYQKKWAKLFFDNGVDLVIGTHPHVIEPVEEFKSEDDGPEMLVFYSLGNFVNWTSGTGSGVANRMVGGMANITIERDEEGDVYISDYYIKALVTDLSEGEDGVVTYPLSEYNATLADENEIKNQDNTFSYEYCVELCDKVWGDIWE